MEDAKGELLSNVLQTVNDTSRLPVQSPAERVKLTGAVVGLAKHTILISKNGRSTAIDDSGAPIRDDDGNLTGIVVVFRDIEERRAAERERDALTEQLYQVFAATTDAVAVLDRSWRFTFLNDYAKALLAPAGEVLGQDLWKTFPATVFEGSPYQEHYYRAMTERVPSEFEIYYPAPLNTWFQIIVRPAADGIVLFFRDVTNRRRAERNLELLSDSGRALAQSLDMQTILENVAQTAVRTFSDFCYFDPALHRLERQGWVRSDWKQTESNQRAKFYRITATGKKQLADDLGRWQRIVQAVTSIIDRKPEGNEV